MARELQTEASDLSGREEESKLCMANGYEYDICMTVEKRVITGNTGLGNTGSGNTGFIMGRGEKRVGYMGYLCQPVYPPIYVFSPVQPVPFTSPIGSRTHH